MHANSAVAAIRTLSLLTSSLPDVVVSIGSVTCTLTSSTIQRFEIVPP
jgi:hypothetical protein